MAARLFIYIILFQLFILTGTATFAQQKVDTVTVHTYKEDSTAINTEDTALIKKHSTVIIVAKDTSIHSKKRAISKDSSIERRFNPRKALFRSAVLPGWGQFYNKKYWKIPIIYAALGITAGVFFYNLKTYKLLRDAVIYRYEGDSSRVAPELQDLPTNFLQQNRDIFRQNIDYSVLVFMGFWVLNMIDADVDANLKSFNVSPDIGMRIKPGFNNNFNPGVSLVFFFKEKSNLPTMPLP
ncbi:MAG TPA: DUF5683 domain-containing protein [Hanamia sp.]